MYAMLSCPAASKTVEFILECVEEFTGVTIISPRSEKIAEFINQKTGSGLTIYSGKGAFKKRGDTTILQRIYRLL